MPAPLRAPTRRALLLGPAALLAPACLLTGAASPLPDEPPLPATAGLNRRALRKNRFYGAAIDERSLRGDAALMAHVAAECGMLGSETAFKWAAIHPAPDRYDFSPADMLLAFASHHTLRARGHALLWHQANPAWLAPALTPATGEALLTTHIRTVTRHFRRRLAHWDVANEVLNPEDGRPDGLRDTLWLRALGHRYLDIAFHACAEGDPTALRCLNEYGLDDATPAAERKRGKLLDLLAGMRARNVPIQAVGLQAHLDASDTHLDQTVLARFCADLAGLGLRLIVTEMDIRDDRVPGDIPARDAAVAAIGRAYLDPILANPATLGVLTWGLSDRHSWLQARYHRSDAKPLRPLPLDAELRRKPLWTAMAGCFDTAPSRPG